MRILRLPLLCVMEVIKNMNLLELYNFSMISERASVIAKLLSKKFQTPEKAYIYTREGFSLLLEYSEFVYWHFKFTRDEKRSENHLYDPCIKPIKWESRTFFFQDLAQGGLQFADFLIHLFNVSMTEIEFNLSEASVPNDLIRIIEWINTQKQLETTKTTIFVQTYDLLPLVVQKYQKKTEQFHIRAAFENQRPDPTIILSPNLELDSLCVHSLTDSVHGMSIDFLLSSNFPKIDMDGQSMSCQDINTFLYGWKNGKTNSRLKYCTLRMDGRIDMKTILKGLKPIVHDPNTTKIVNRYDGFNCCYYSGIDIRGIDGKRAKFYLETYWLREGEDAEIHQEVIDDSEDLKELKEDEEENDGFSHDEVNRRWLFWIEIE